nr:hypothetical protein [Tanacetum cinerariifolium]
PEESDSSPSLLPKVLAIVPANRTTWSSKRASVISANKNASSKREFFVSRPTTLDDAFLLALITEARLDDQVVLLAGIIAKTFGNNDGDESDSSGPVTPTEEDD